MHTSATSHDIDEVRRLSITDPRDGTPVGDLQVSDAADIDRAIARAREQQARWAAQTPADRGAALRDMADRLEAHTDELAAWNERETGKLLDDAKGGIAAAVGTLRQYAELGPLHRGHSLRGPATATDYSVREPRGVIAAITPWNDPVAVAVGLIAAALVTGNTVVHKPSERCPHTGRLLGDVLASALPDDVLLTVTGDASTGEALVRDERIDMIAHVGSSDAGARIAAIAAERGAHVIRENGGNDPLIVDQGIDPVWAAEQAALGSFANAGQICVSVERIYVHREIADAFLDALVGLANDHRWAAGQPLVDERMRTSVHDQVSEAVSAGARVLAGGSVPAGPGAHYPATVLSGCTPAMRVMTEETFGPIAPVQVVDSFHEALRLAAEGPYGLSAAVLTGRIDHAQDAIARLPVGTVKVNGVFGGAPGGSAEPRGVSGAGFGYGPELLDEMTRVKVVHIERPRYAGDDGGAQ
ncbi:aldehyde dehydrogenase family protein [Cumulibacter manganitolerans]|uniref:aldehyde dehydrogenase family protein n=1 Tax=Cumulibacter manganitolerans TaxID=1884992 RepID=UPI001E33F8F3|nr:aldehyde dehydrogenase family protein [Cumulibacter manganitolerans]